MAVPLPVDIVMGALPLGFKGNLQEYANAIADAMSATVDATFLTGQIGGSMPTHDVGPWANGTEWWFWDPTTGSYQPSDQGTPVGTVIFWGGSGVPNNWLLCDGRPVSRSTYSRLYQAILNTWGGNDQNGTFNLPPGGRVPIGSPGFAAVGTLGGAASVNLIQAYMPVIDIQTWSHVDTFNANGGTTLHEIHGIGTTGEVAWAIWHATADDGTPLGSKQIPTPTMPPYMAVNLVIKYQ